MIFEILKIIGICFLTLIAMVMVILFFVLFVPIRYRFFGEYEDELEGQVHIVWLPLCMKITFFYQNNHLNYVIRMLGGIIMTNTNQPLSWLGKRIFKGRQSESAKELKRKKDGVRSEKDTEKNSLTDSDVWEKTSLERLQDREVLTKDYENPKKNLKSIKKMSKHYSVVKRVRDKINRMCHQIKEKWRRFVRSLKKMKQKKQQLIKIYHSKRFERFLIDVKKYIKVAFEILKPKRIDGYIKFGFEDPSQTGEILGLLAMLYPVYKKTLIVEPVFTTAILKASLKGKGKIRLISVFLLGIKVILNKNLIKVTKRVQTILEA